MAAIHKLFTLLAAITLITSAAAEDYSQHPFVIRIREFENIPKNPEHDDDLPEITDFLRTEINQYVPMDGSEREVNYGESLIVLLKMFATLRSYFSAKGIDTIEFKDTFSEVMKELITDRIQDPAMELRNNQGLAEYLLDWSTYLVLIDVLGKYRHERCEMEWISYACLLAIENSSYLKNTFSKGMLLKLNIMRNHANTANAIHLINEDDQDTLSADNLIKFPFDKIMIDMKLFNWNGSNTQFLESQFKRILIEETLESSLEHVKMTQRLNRRERAVTPFYTAFLELSDDELTNYVNELGYALGWYGGMLNSKIVKILNSLLESRCQRLVLRGLDERLQDFAFIVKNVTEVFEEPMQLDSKHMEYYKILLRVMNIDSFEGETITRHNQIFNVFYRVGDLMLEPAIFNDRDRLNEYDQHHIQLFEASESLFFIPLFGVDIEQNSAVLVNYLNKIEELFDSIETSENSFNIRNQIRILIRLAIHFINLNEDSFRMLDHPIIRKIAIAYTKLMGLGADVFVSDSMLIKEWYRFYSSSRDIIQTVLTPETMEAFSHYNNSANPSSDADAVLYIFLTRITNYLATQQRFSDANCLIKPIMELEEKVGYADGASTFIQEHVLREKQLFYIFYYSQAAEFQTDLTKLIEHHVELITSLRFWHEDWIEHSRDLIKRQLLDVIYTATVNDPDAENHLDDPNGQLRNEVNQLMNCLSRDYGLDDVFADKVQQCQGIFGQVIV